MTDGLLEQRLHHLLSQYGQVEAMQHFPQAHDGATIILATMKTAEEAIAVQHALGLSLFGFNSLIIREDWVKEHWQDN